MKTMDNSEFINIFLKKLNKLYDFSNNDKNNRIAIVSEINKIIDWVISDRSLQQFRLYHAFITWLFASYGKKYSNRENFIDDIKRLTGYCKIDETFTEINGEKIKFRKYRPFSTAFGVCSQKVFNEYFERVKVLAYKKWMVKFDDWFNENEGVKHG
jgi:IS1 family transposase